jgi:hypothetical protein
MNARLGMIGALLTLGVLIAVCDGVANVAAEPVATQSVQPPPVLPSPELLNWQDIVKHDGNRFALSARVKSLAGRRVRLTGYMAKLELPPKGGFYLTAQSVHGDESGAGTGDLPLDSILVLSRTVTDRPIETIDGPVEVSGALETGNQEDSEGRSNWLRIRLDPVTTPQAQTSPSTPARDVGDQGALE